ncbi:hypothetical protein [Vibrio parahaemolyticus]|uniref:hypothetical protein n=2 Tax=Vibrio parahaemolyticus TaxID=670 RepID=UPI00205C4C13|nr:hypothetical protein [Vibrio parahaemolyticus]MBE4373247.1 hypothetical protein [Vibrio parahaemolyticus]UPR13102.1 hypothetical protein H9K44_21490 [Vibrio parahaemolyticus]HCD5196908.1 hypothetical protein [Vibrio parahaemolyticus]HCE1490525.1 hypothetical protein [Vibrio parahaemolyticus]HCE2197565.1 hypothetical protein [Vibrio parahaemolyticus]
MSIATDTLPNIQTVEELIKEYYRTQVTKPELDQERVDKVINFNLASYRLPFINTSAPKAFSSRKDEITYLLSGSNLVKENKLCAYHHEFIREGLQQLLVTHDELLKEGYKTVSSQEHNLFHQLSVNKLIMKKPDCLIEEDIKTIKAQVEYLIEELNEIERKEKMDVVKAQEWAKNKHSEQKAAYDKAIAELAASEANSLNDMYVNFSQYFDSIESRYYWFFDDLKDMCGNASNKDIEEVLTHLNFIPLRKYLADDKQHKLWVKESEAENLDYKSIQYKK